MLRHMETWRNYLAFEGSWVEYDASQNTAREFGQNMRAVVFEMQFIQLIQNCANSFKL